MNAIAMAILAAALYAINTPLSKILLGEIGSSMLAGLLYLGAGIGMLGIWLPSKKSKERNLTKKDLPYTVGMVVLDIAAPIFMMMGLQSTTAANASLLNNFEIVATSVIALLVFHEKIGKKLWAAIVLISIASILLSIEGEESFQFSSGSILVLLACVSWGLENNCTRMISNSNPQEIVVIKGLGAGIGAILIAVITGESFPDSHIAIIAMLLGFASYGLSVFFYVYAQRYLGAARTSAYYALSPFIGAGLSFIIFSELPSMMYIIALAVMVVGAVLAANTD